MRHSIPVGTAALALLLSACGPTEVIVTAQIDVEDPVTGETVTRSLQDLEIRLFPFDRDAMFDSLATAFGTPEPPIPEDLLAARAEIAEAQRNWTDQQNRWNLLRDTLQTLTDALEQYNRGEARYVALYNEWQDLDAEYSRIERTMDRAFQRFDSLQRANIAAAQAVRLERDEWADQAFADVNDVIIQKLRAAGGEILADTTEATGVGRFDVKPGTYWVTALYEEVYTELYWNVRIEVPGGEPLQVVLTRANAQERPKL